MALTKDTIRSDYPLPVYNYRVEIGSEAVAFSEVSGLSIAYETTTYKESPIGGSAGPRTMHMPAQAVPPKLTLRKGIVRGVSIRTLYGWIKTVQTNEIDKRDVVIRLCDENGDPVISWKLGNAFPVKLDAPSFDAKSNDVAIETMELMADYIQIEES